MNITKENIIASLPNDPDGLYKQFDIKTGTSKEKRLLDILINLTKKKIVSYQGGMYRLGESVSNQELTLLEQARLAEGKTDGGLGTG